MRVFFFAFFSFFASFSYGAVIEWDHSLDYSTEQEVFLHAFSNVYDELGTEALHVPDIHAFLEEAIKEEVQLAKRDPDIHWVRAKEKDRTVGMIIFETHHYPDEVYIRQTSLEPEFQRRGIGRELVLSLFDRFPETGKVVVITRKVNAPSIEFYHALGFTDCPYMHEGYDPDRYFGMEFNR